ncbi:MAG: hypothetical protein KDI82_00930, partial [Gammaproteobacteria bacterium]|nr:hypothetical protein [Gammaproteobacteria bacterium]
QFFRLKLHAMKHSSRVPAHAPGHPDLSGQANASRRRDCLSRLSQRRAKDRKKYPLPDHKTA